jgi:hypothetical protein
VALLFAATIYQRNLPRPAQNRDRKQQGGENSMSNQNRSKSQMVPEARAALNNMKFEIARELGVNLKQGYNGDLSSRENGYVGGYMVKRLIEQAERQMAGK